MNVVLSVMSVSYTHLDVYKRQHQPSVSFVLLYPNYAQSCSYSQLPQAEDVKCLGMHVDRPLTGRKEKVKKKINSFDRSFGDM